MKEEILRLTNEGLDFFKFVYPELNERGNKAFFGSKPLGKSIFYNDSKASLSIFFKGGKWKFHDFGNDDYKGDCFDFAGFYYGLDVVNDFTELCQRINQDLFLAPAQNIQRVKIVESVKIEKPISYHDFDLIAKASNKAFYQKNVFAKFFLDFFEHDTRAYEVLQMYYVGTAKTANYATCFPQIDKQGRVHAVKLQAYQLSKKTDNDYSWNDCNRIEQLSYLHSLLELSDFNLRQCLFGEHLTNTTKPIAVVESAKTALFGAMYFPQFVWVSTEGEGNFLNIRNLAGKHVILFPDNNAKWVEKIADIEPYLASLKVSKFLIQYKDKLPNSIANKADLADFFIFSTQCKGLTIDEFLPKKKQVQTPFISDNDYIDSLFFEGDRLMTGTQDESHPASWDLTAPYISQKAKDFVKLTETAPNTLKLKELLGLKII